MTHIKLGLADDHVMLRKGLAGIVKNIGYTVLVEADNGKELVDKISAGLVPDVVLLDINMPHMDGYDTARWLKKNQPDIKILALSMYDDENAIIRMLKNGAKGYILKEAEPEELGQAIHSVLTKGFYYSEMVTGKLIHSIGNLDEEDSSTRKMLNLSEREMEFLKYACTEMTYKEIADKMYLSPRTIDGYRDALFEKLNIKTRVGLAMYAIKNGIVRV
jgi:two-component system, NarL family, invasion response regulator UvrY